VICVDPVKLGVSTGQTHLNLSKKPEQRFPHAIVPSRLESLLLNPA
jgi:hypothetical protein